jgi:hypothetical protein
VPRGTGPFPDLELPDAEGIPHRLSEAWKNGPALAILGHRTCKTTRETLPLVDRINARRGPGTSVFAILQDDADTARSLVSQLRLGMPVRLEADPYPVAAALEVTTVPSLFLIGADGGIESVSEALRRADLERFAERLGVLGPLFDAADKVPALKPG